MKFAANKPPGFVVVVGEVGLEDSNEDTDSREGNPVGDITPKRGKLPRDGDGDTPVEEVGEQQNQFAMPLCSDNFQTTKNVQVPFDDSDSEDDVDRAVEFSEKRLQQARDLSGSETS